MLLFSIFLIFFLELFWVFFCKKLDFLKLFWVFFSSKNWARWDRLCQHITRNSDLGAVAFVGTPLVFWYPPTNISRFPGMACRAIGGGCATTQLLDIWNQSLLEHAQRLYIPVAPHYHSTTHCRVTNVDSLTLHWIYTNCLALYESPPYVGCFQTV